MCSLVVSDLRSKKKVPGSSSAASYVQGRAHCSNCPGNVCELSENGREELNR